MYSSYVKIVRTLSRWHILRFSQSSLIPTPQCQTRQGKWGALPVELSNQMISVSSLGPCDAVFGSDLYTKNFPNIMLASHVLTNTGQCCICVIIYPVILFFCSVQGINCRWSAYYWYILYIFYIYFMTYSMFCCGTGWEAAVNESHCLDEIGE